ncbi:branched-chain amino acid aminotransferase [Vibrio maritimus]|uniref:Aminodeoxychorismate lyase n=1 Tax=Vibrio maritimus TaxID=990268 RepID=A0A090T3Y0_9VIBR|nr:branched-chain amino acid aminotransferase [Vibrio maritimus]
MWLQAVIETNQVQDCVLKLMLTGGESEDGMTPISCNIIVMASELKRPNPAVYKQGVKLVTMEHLRESPTAKHFNYSSAASQIQHMTAQGGYELLYHHQGLVSEASRSNIFIVKDGVLRTPRTDILLGIARQNVLQLAKERQLPMQEAPITMGMCLSAQEVFITGSSKRIVPVVQIDNTQIGLGRVGQITQSLMQYYQVLIDAQLNKS